MNGERAGKFMLAVSTGLNLVAVGVMALVVMPKMDQIIRQGEAAVQRDQDQLDALDSALKRSIANQELNRRLLEDTIRGLKAAKPPEDR